MPPLTLGRDDGNLRRGSGTLVLFAAVVNVADSDIGSTDSQKFRRSTDSLIHSTDSLFH